MKGVLWWVEKDTAGYTAWLDDVKLDRVDPAVLALRPAVVSDARTLPLTATDTVALRLGYTELDGSARTLDTEAAGSGPARAFFTFASSNPAVATVDAAGKITPVAVGQALVTAFFVDNLYFYR